MTAAKHSRLAAAAAAKVGTRGWVRSSLFGGECGGGDFRWSIIFPGGGGRTYLGVCCRCFHFTTAIMQLKVFFANVECSISCVLN